MNARIWFGTIILLMLGCAIAALIFVPIPSSNESNLFQLIGALGTLSGLVIGYYFSISDSSSKKTDLLLSRASGKANDPIHVEPEVTNEKSSLD